MHRSSVTKATILTLLTLPLLTLGQKCTSANAITIPLTDNTTPVNPTPGTNPSSTGTGCEQFKSDPSAYQVCLDVALQGQCNSVGCGDSDLDSDPSDLVSTSNDLIGAGSDLISDSIRKMKRATTSKVDLTCKSSETCVMDEYEALYCVNTDTGDFRDDEGGKGNLITMEYTPAAGDEDDDGASTTSSTTRSATKSAIATATSSATATGTSVASSNSTSGSDIVRSGLASVCWTLGLMAASIMSMV